MVGSVIDIIIKAFAGADKVNRRANYLRNVVSRFLKKEFIKIIYCDGFVKEIVAKLVHIFVY